MLAALILSTQLLAQPQLELPAGEPIQLDGRIEPAEWAGAFRVSRPIEGGRKLKFLLMRTGPWLAVGVEAGRPYVGETARLYVANEAGTMINSMVLGFGQPTLAPASWRRGPPESLQGKELITEVPRACRLRMQLGEADSWSAEYLVRLSALGVGRGDTRKFGLLIALGTDAPRAVLYMVLPQGAQSPLSARDYAVLAPQGGWGSDERWEPVSPEASLEFDDHELLHRLGLEQAEMQGREQARHLVLRTATTPRIESEIARLRTRLEAGKRRNPTLSSWDYYLGRLLHAANLRTEARAVVEGIPDSLLDLAPFLDLAAKHYFDSEDFERTITLCKAHRDAPSASHFLSLAQRGKEALSREQQAREQDAKKDAKNPRIRLHTSKGNRSLFQLL